MKMSIGWLSEEIRRIRALVELFDSRQEYGRKHYRQEELNVLRKIRSRLIKVHLFGEDY